MVTRVQCIFFISKNTEKSAQRSFNFKIVLPSLSSPKFSRRYGDTELAVTVIVMRFQCFFFISKNVQRVQRSFNFRNVLPSLSSPKFPQPIFLPTRKLGPTMRTPEDEVTECRDVCIALLPTPRPPPTAPVALQVDTHLYNRPWQPSSLC